MDFNIILDLTILVVIGIVYFLLKNAVPSYFSEKGKNLATQQDIRKITDEIESVKQTYQKEIEELKASLAKDKEINSLALQARNISLSSFSNKTGKAIQNMWDLMVDFRNNSGFELTQAEFIQLSSGYEKEFWKPGGLNQSETANSLSVEIASAELGEAFKKLKKDRVWLGKDLFEKYSSYVSMIGIIRVKFIRYLKNGDKLNLSEEEILMKLLTDFYSEEIIEEYDHLKNFSSISVILNSIENQILNDITEIQTGEKATRETIEHATKIENIKKEFT